MLQRRCGSPIESVFLPAKKISRRSQRSLSCPEGACFPLTTRTAGRGTASAGKHLAAL